MSVSIRILRSGEDGVLQSIADDVFDHDIDERHLGDYLGAPDHILCVAVADGLVIGQARAVIHRHPDKAREIYIDNAGVAPAFQRRGIATRMLRALIEVGRERGCAEVWVGTEPDNEPAKALYRSMGLKMETVVTFDGAL